MNNCKNVLVSINYTRADALLDKDQFDISSLAKEYGFVYPIFITRSVDLIVTESTQYGLNDREGVLWDILSVLRAQIKANAGTKATELNISVLISWENNEKKKFDFIVVVEAMDFNDPAPAITIMTSIDV